jgi:hypothetical protein
VITRALGRIPLTFAAALQVNSRNTFTLCFQDPADKKVVVCDEKLKALFAGRERVGFLEIAKLLNPHFVK